MKITRPSVSPEGNEVKSMAAPAFAQSGSFLPRVRLSRADLVRTVCGLALRLSATTASLLKRRVRTTRFIQRATDCIITRTIAPPKVLSIDETIHEIVTGNCSVSRYGDGELKHMAGLKTELQPFSKELSSRLRTIIASDEPKLLICIPDIFTNLERHKDEERAYWTEHLVTYRLVWYSVLNMNKPYYNAFMSTFYNRFLDKSRCGSWFTMIKHIWEERDVVLVEGEKSRLGVGNDLFDNVRSIKRILAPAKDAFSKYAEILNEVQQQERTNLVLVALGITATVLAYDLHKMGFQAIDIGHIDIEYEWYLRKATTKLRIENKFVNQVPNGDKVHDCIDPRYKEQIISVIR